MQRGPTRRYVVGAAAVLAASGALYGLGARINTTESIPLGLYWSTNDQVARGSYVEFCPPARPPFLEARDRHYLGAGFCSSGIGYMMKHVVAAAGDNVVINDSGVYVNGNIVPHSAPLPTDASGRPLPRLRGDFHLSDSQVLLMGDVNPKSFDGRYFGPIERNTIRGSLRPVFLW